MKSDNLHERIREREREKDKKMTAKQKCLIERNDPP